MTNSNLSTNLKIIEELTEIIKANPDWRFQQTLWNSGIISRDYNDQDKLEIEDRFYETSEMTLNKLLNNGQKSKIEEYDIEHKVKSIIAEELGIEESNITNNSNLFNDLGLDSLDIVELTVLFEEEFNISIPDEETENLKTVQNIIEYLSKNKK